MLIGPFDRAEAIRRASPSVIRVIVVARGTRLGYYLEILQRLEIFK